MGTNNNSDRESSSYIQKVLNSKVALNLKKFGGSLNEKKINEIRNELKVECNNQEEIPCDIMNKRCLFKILEDPCEKKNLAEDPQYAEILQDLVTRLESTLTKVAQPRNKGGREGGNFLI